MIYINKELSKEEKLEELTNVLQSNIVTIQPTDQYEYDDIIDNIIDDVIFINTDKPEHLFKLKKGYEIKEFNHLNILYYVDIMTVKNTLYQYLIDNQL
ncbi:MAG: hypothetical protein ACOCRK_06995 [bacterium]